MSLETLRLGSPAKVGEPEAASLADRRWLVQGASDKLTSAVASSSYRSMDYDEMQSTSGGDAWDDENMDGVEGQVSAMPWLRVTASRSMASKHYAHIELTLYIRKPSRNLCQLSYHLLRHLPGGLLR